VTTDVAGQYVVKIVVPIVTVTWVGGAEGPTTGTVVLLMLGYGAGGGT
jgi:hypothetical protein